MIENFIRVGSIFRVKQEIISLGIGRLPVIHKQRTTNQNMSSILSFLFLVATMVAVQGTVLNVVRQDSQRAGFIEKFDTSNPDKMISSSDVGDFAFSWPHVQMTSNTRDQEVYVITYPEGAPGAVLFHLNKDLQQINKWDNVSFNYFDLQYSNLQSTLYGIYVSSTYGRVLSNFTLDASSNYVPVPDQLFTLPYMWYVNASSFHHPSCHYYALINYFPGHPESTLDQQLVVADFSKESSASSPPKVNVYPITHSQGVIQFIGYSDYYKHLFFAGMSSNSTMAMVGKLNTLTGEVSNIIFKTPGLAVGPLVIDEVNHSLTFYVKSGSATWQLWMLKANEDNTAVVEQLTTEINDSDVFAASSIGF
jgi:hypothetical protein